MSFVAISGQFLPILFLQYCSLAIFSSNIVYLFSGRKAQLKELSGDKTEGGGDEGSTEGGNNSRSTTPGENSRTPQPGNQGELQPLQVTIF